MQIEHAARILYGSDWPWSPEPLVSALARQLDATPLLTDRQRQDVMRRNALALFPKFA